ncbi:amylo-alpha-1,6-glucosidase [Methylovirgula ligni]|uniref:Glycogen debranching enzyme n=1 Tax=Methylovirgula ligni TaxID=569860 RepID=A0A3D9YYT0_9HYPH|nr:amylo-alpha-1,6-glucosidase [Methylovirgula ligni]QAY96608.1 amylo-alpha-1,6-glucosidase [Methylovirgula ligni]REF84079.1 glycogen debranching enzyme [Methylovirgula ligni]
MERVFASEDDIGTSFEPISDYYIEPKTSLVESSLRVLKHNDIFAVLDSYGDIGVGPEGPEGLFLRDTRHLSKFDLRFEGRRPLFLGSAVEADNASLSADSTNPDIHLGAGIFIPRDAIAMERTKLLFEAGCYERVGFFNYDHQKRRFRIAIHFDADFRDLFEVRGMHRKARGTRAACVVGHERVELRYEGLDKINRYTILDFSPAPQYLDTKKAEFDFALQPGEKCSILVSVACGNGEASEPLRFLTAYRGARRSLKALTRNIATVESSNVVFNEIACRATSDVYTLVSQTEAGLYPYAGIPWFSTIFGRDGIITAMMMLWIDPMIAKGVLLYLAGTQARHVDLEAGAEPGKILHEVRHGEMANLKEVPFGRCYTTVDATPLFVMLAGLYFERTGDRTTIETIWPNIEAALLWCDTSGDKDKDGFVEYFRESEAGLVNQGWKDSDDSIFHADGSKAQGPIALCEVQGYVYAAKRAASTLARTLGRAALAENLDAQSETLRQRFHDAFWCEEIGTYALALDGAKRQCRVRSSNAGHALFTGIADLAYAARVADSLTSPEAFSGWGIRTIFQGESRYNPISYHNGSIWPHDNALIAAGFDRYGLKAQAAKVFSAMFDAASNQDLRRLPELFCGFGRRPRRGPTDYPVACAPQAWASAAPFTMLSACIGLSLRHDSNEIHFTDPRLPDFLDDLTIRNLQLGETRADIRLCRDGADVTVSVLSRNGPARIVQVK